MGLLALTLELYETLLPDLRGSREGWLRRVVIPALEREADIRFTRAVFRREDVEAVVAEFEAARAARATGKVLRDLHQMIHRAGTLRFTQERLP